MRNPRQSGRGGGAQTVSNRRAPESGFWLTTFLFAIPFGFVVTLAATALAMGIAATRSGDATAGNLSGALWSSVVIGMLIFFGFCYLIVPIAMVLLGLLRLVSRAAKTRRPRRNVARSSREVDPVDNFSQP